MPIRVTGIGGVFLRARDPEELLQWYRTHLGIEPEGGTAAHFRWRDLDRPERVGRTVWSLFPADTEYFGPSGQAMMINYRVEDLDAALATLRGEGVEIVGREDYDYGRFAWIVDLEGNRIELWEPLGE